MMFVFDSLLVPLCVRSIGPRYMSKINYFYEILSDQVKGQKSVYLFNPVAINYVHVQLIFIQITLF